MIINYGSKIVDKAYYLCIIVAVIGALLYFQNMTLFHYIKIGSSLVMAMSCIWKMKLLNKIYISMYVVLILYRIYTCIVAKTDVYWFCCDTILLIGYFMMFFFLLGLYISKKYSIIACILIFVGMIFNILLFTYEVAFEYYYWYAVVRIYYSLFLYTLPTIVLFLFIVEDSVQIEPLLNKKRM